MESIGVVVKDAGEIAGIVEDRFVVGIVVVAGIVGVGMLLDMMPLDLEGNWVVAYGMKNKICEIPVSRKVIDDDSFLEKSKLENNNEMKNKSSNTSKTREAGKSREQEKLRRNEILLLLILLTVHYLSITYERTIV